MSPAIPSRSSERDSSSAKFKHPKLRFEIRDLTHSGAKSLLAAINTAECLATAVQNVLRLLYSSPSCPTTTLPPTRSVTLILRDMPGVAYTTGSDLDSDHKEVHFSLTYISRINSSRITEEITGVITHELVHCFQYNGHGSCPGGLIEGIADWVRLNCNLSPPHWKRESDGKWDRGYQHTAYFLEYLETRFGKGTVQQLNEKLRTQRYEEKAFWTELVGRPVEQLWGDYVEKLKDDEAVLVNKEDVSGDENMTKSKIGSNT
ncbi:Fc.00g091070.m01.CDS01 [Cosmosporella sp. VM-42]